MKIGIISDIHDNLPRLRDAQAMMSSDVKTVICCGDLCSPFVVKELGTGFNVPVHIVFGNNDGDRFRITTAAQRFDHLHLHGEFAELELGGRLFAVNHFDDIARGLAGNPRYDVVCFGHNHQLQIEPVEKTLLVNPGEIYGMLTGASTFVLYDSDQHHATRVDIL